MKTIYMSLAAVSALAVAAPLAAQPWNGNRSDIGELRMQLDAGIERGTITPREARPLRASLGQLVRMERQFSGRGFSRAERNTLQLRSASLTREIDRAANNRVRTANWDRNDRRVSANDDRRNNHGKGNFASNERRDHRGDRFAGDLRVGQHVSARQGAVPMQYRDRFRDSDSSYYRYDEDRIYQVDRSTGVILAMFDI